MKRLLGFCGGVWGVLALAAAPGAAPAVDAEAQALAAEIRSARPAGNTEVRGLMRMRDAQGRRTRTPFRYQVVVASDREWRSIYEIDRAGAMPGEKVVVVHTDGQPTRYLFEGGGVPAAGGGAPAVLTGDRAMVPFANSDFWLADLGLDYLGWPTQRLVDETKVKRRKGRVCRVLESENPAPGAQGYVRVVSWIDLETRKPILAEAYDGRGRLLKEFEIGGLTKVNGRWELKDMEMRSALTDSQTVLEFRYEAPEDAGTASAPSPQAR